MGKIPVNNHFFIFHPIISQLLQDFFHSQVMTIPCWWLNSAPHDTSLPSASLLDGLSGAMCGALLETFLGGMRRTTKPRLIFKYSEKMLAPLQISFATNLVFWEADQFVHSPLVAGWQKFPNHGYTIQFFRLITWRV